MIAFQNLIAVNPWVIWLAITLASITFLVTAAWSLRRAQYASFTRQQREQIANLNTVSVLLSSSLQMEDVQEKIVSSAAMLANGDAVALYLPDEFGKALRLVRTAGLSEHFRQDPPDLLLTMTHAYPQKPSEQLTELRPIAVADVQQDTRLTGFNQRHMQEKIAALTEIPLVSGESLRGAIVVYYKKRAQPADPVKLEYLRMFASAALQAVQNAQLYTSIDQALVRRVEQLAALAMVGREVNATNDLPRIAQLILNSALDGSRAIRGTFAFREPGTTTFTAAATSGYPAGGDPLQISPDKTEIRNTLASGEVTYLPEKALFLTPSPAKRTQIIVPFQSEYKSSGILLLESESNQEFSEEDRSFAVQLLDQTGLVLDNIHLFNRMKETRDRLQLILDTMTEAIILIDANSYIRIVNPAVRQLGLDPIDLIDQPVEALLKQPTRHKQLMSALGASAATLEHVLRGEDEQSVVYSVEQSTRVRYIERQVYRLSSEHPDAKAGLLLVFYDQTEKIQLDRTRDDLSRMIVHDLRSPMSAVISSLRLMQEILQDEAKPLAASERTLMLRTIDTSQQAIDKLLHRVESLLDVAKMQSGAMELETDVYDLYSGVEAVFSDLGLLAKERGIQLNNAIARDFPPLAVDPEKTDRVIQNLLDNAIKYSPAQTVVNVTASLLPENGLHPRFAQVEVCDQGNGVPVALREKLFDRFYQIRHSNSGNIKGVGLGLTLCRMVIEAQGGRIWIEDNPGGGSRFVFTLPMLDLADFAQEAETQPEQEP